MDRLASLSQVHDRLVGPLHVEAMLLADEARAYFDTLGRRERAGLDPAARVAFSCESLKLTTRLMHVTAWLTAERARAAQDDVERPTSARRLGPAPESAEGGLARLPEAARALIEASIDLHGRVRRLDGSEEGVAASPARAMFERLNACF